MPMGAIGFVVLVLEAIRLIGATPGPLPDVYGALRELQQRAAAQAAGGAIGGDGLDPWAIIGRVGDTVEEIKVDVERRYNPPAGAGEMLPVAFDPNAALDEAALNAGDPDRLRAHDCAISGLAAMEQRGVFTELDALVRAGVGECFDLHPRTFEIACSRGARVRELYRVLYVRAELARSSGAMDVYLQAIEQQLALGRIIGHQVGLTSRQARHRIVESALAQLRRDVMLGVLGGAQGLPEVSTVLQRQLRLPGSAFWLEAQGASVNTFIARTHTLERGAGGVEDGRLVISAYRTVVLQGPPIRFREGMQEQLGPLGYADLGRLSNVFGVRYLPRSKTQALADDFVQRSRALAEMSLEKQIAGAGAIETWAEGLPHEAWVVKLYAAGMASTYPRVFRQDRDAALMDVGVRTLVAIEQFRVAQRRLPKTLDELTPGLLDKPPTDPFSDSGAVLRYVVADAQETRPGVGYVLYSVWDDAKDDAGKRVNVRMQSSASWRQRAGFDFIINDAQDVMPER